MENTDFVLSVKEQTQEQSRFDITRLLKISMAKAVKESTLSAYHILAGIAELTGLHYNPNTLYNWTSLAHTHLPPAGVLPAFCKITQNYEPVIIFLSPLKKILSDIVGQELLTGLDILNTQERIKQVQKQLLVLDQTLKDANSPYLEVTQ